MVEDADSHFAYDPAKNAHLKGRRRFKADLEDLEVFAAAGYVMKGMRLASECYVQLSMQIPNAL